MKRISVGKDINTRYLSGGSWRSRKNTRNPSLETSERRKAKRTRLGNATMRALYTHVKAHTFPEYASLCRRADKLNGRRHES